MKKDNKLVIAIVLAAVVLAGVAMNTQATSYSAKTAAGYNTTEILREGDGTTETVMFQPLTIKTSEKKDLVISVTAQNTIVTDTRLKGEFGEEDSVIIVVRPTVDGNPTCPSQVTFASRIQKIEGRLSDIIQDCEWGDYDNDATTPDTYECVLIESPEWLNLTLNTTSANGFNFLYPNAGAGNHEIIVHVSMEASSTTLPDETLPNRIAGIIGPRTLVVNEVRLANAYATHEL